MTTRKTEPSPRAPRQRNGAKPANGVADGIAKRGLDGLGPAVDDTTPIIVPGAPPVPVSTVEIDADDDISTIREKLDLADTNRVALLVPNGAKELQNPVRMKLLRRYGRNLAKDIVVVARDGEVRRLAKEEGFPIASSVKGIERRFPTRGRRKALDLGAFGVGTGLLGGLVVILAIALVALVGAVLLVPSATVEIAPVTNTTNDVITVKASKLAKGVNQDTRTIAGRTVTADVEVSGEAKTTGKQTNVDGKAKGKVTFTNTSGGPITIKKGTVIRTVTGDIRFTTDNDITAENGKPETVNITAVEAGTRSNIGGDRGSPPPLAIVDPDLASAKLAVALVGPTSGGDQKPASFVTADDRRKLREALLDKLKVDGYARLYEVKQQSESIYRDTVTVTPVEETPSNFVDEVTDTLGMTIKAKVSAIAFDSKLLTDLGTRIAKSQIPAGQQLLPGSLELAPQGIAGMDDDSISFQVALKYQVIPTIDENEVTKALTGRTADDARDYLASRYPLVRPADITITPGVFGVLPRLASRISVRIIGA